MFAAASLGALSFLSTFWFYYGLNIRPLYSRRRGPPDFKSVVLPLWVKVLTRSVLGGIVAFALVFGITSNLLFAADTWDAIGYPDKNNLSVSVNLGRSDSLEQCRQAVERWKATLPNPARTDYECGLNCKPTNGVFVCEKTKD